MADNILEKAIANAMGTTSFAQAVEVAAMEAEERKEKKKAKDKLMSTRASRANQPAPAKKTSEQLDAEASARRTDKREKREAEAREKLEAIQEKKDQALRDRGVVPSSDMPDLPESGPLESDEEVGFGGSGEQDFGDPDFGLKLVEDLVPDEVRQEQAAELMAPKAEKFFDVLGLDVAPTDVLEDQDMGFKQVMLDDSGEEKEEGSKSLAELRAEDAAKPPKVVRVLPDREKMESFFKTATKSKFDPNSKRDRAYMEKIKGLLEKNPEFADLTPGKFAMKLYAAG